MVRKPERRPRPRTLPTELPQSARETTAPAAHSSARPSVSARLDVVPTAAMSPHEAEEIAFLAEASHDVSSRPGRPRPSHAQKAHDSQAQTAQKRVSQLRSEAESLVTKHGYSKVRRRPHSDKHTPVKDEIREQRRKIRLTKRKISRKRIFVAVAVVAALVSVWLVFLFSPLFALHTKDITVVTARGSLVTAGQVRTALTGFEGRSLLRISPEDVVQRIESSIPRASDVKVSRTPLHGLKITVKDYVPSLCRVRGADCVPMNDQGVDIPVTDEEKEALIPVLYTGDDVHMDEYLADYASIRAALPEDLSARIAKIEISEQGWFSFFLDDGALIRWGDNSERDAKIQVLEQIMGVPADMYDVSDPLSPVSGPKSS